MVSREELDQFKLNDLESQMVDPLENLIGFYCTIGSKRGGIGGDMTERS